MNNAIDNRTPRRPFHRMRPISHRQVTLTDSFWAPRLAVNEETTLPSQYRQCEDTGRVDNFRRVSGRNDCKFEGIFFNDSDIYKLLEAVSYVLATHPEDKRLAEIADSLIDEVAAAQDTNGYLNTYFSLERKDERWTNLKDMHELYCAGHMIEAAVAHYDATGKRSLLDVACRFADHIYDTFGHVADGKREGTCGHEEVELALVSLYRATGEERYLKQAAYFIGARGQNPSSLYSQNSSFWQADRRYHQDHVLFGELDEVTGHAVRMMYLACGAADVYAETGDKTWLAALEKQWANMTQRRMYVTGGLGARWEGEAFGKDWELPSDRAYAETCAAIGSIMWQKRMLQIDGDSRYADLMELQLFNAMLAGLSLDGSHYFYQNPLANDGTHRREPWFGCACCPPNVARMLASLTGYFYSADDNSVWVHLYGQGQAQFTLDGGGVVHLRQQTEYPWNGDIALTVVEAPSTLAAINVRIPAWTTGAKVQVNGEEAIDAQAGAYARIERAWKPGDVVRIHLPMEPRLISSDPRVADTSGKIALARGPLVYCLEQVDHAGVDVRDVALSRSAAIEAKSEPEMLGGIVTLEAIGAVVDRGQLHGELYGSGDQPMSMAAAVKVRAIPYYAWANRDAGPMTVWVHSGE